MSEEGDASKVVAGSPPNLVPVEDLGLHPDVDHGTLRSLLSRDGMTDEELSQAEAEGALGLLAVERLVLPDRPRYDQAQAAAAAGMPIESVAQLWRALGFPDPRPGEVLFTESDVSMMRTVAGWLEMGIADPKLIVQMARVIGSSLSRVANAQIDAFDQAVAKDRASGEHASPMEMGALLPTTPQVMDYVWRRHLKAATERRMVRSAAGEANDRLVVGFADLVGFTAMSQQISAQELAAVVDRFETVAYETIAGHGGRVVKMIGDEVMFTVEQAGPGVKIALDLSAAYHDDESLSDVRAGLAVGPVLQREADCYGPVVNRASRIVGIAFPGTVVTDDDIHSDLVESGETGEPDESDREPLLWKSLRARYLKDIGRVQLWSVRRPAGSDAGSTRPQRVRPRR